MKTIPNLGLNIFDGLLFITVISSIVTIYAYYNVHNIKSEVITKIKKQEDRLSYTNYFLLYLNRFIHYFFTIYSFLFLFIFKPNIFIYLIFFVIYLIVFINLLYLQNECPISYLEKKILDNKYIFNSIKYEQVYFTILYDMKISLEFIQYNFVIATIYSFIVFIRLYKHFFIPKSQIPEEIRM